MQRHILALSLLSPALLSLAIAGIIWVMGPYSARGQSAANSSTSGSSSPSPTPPPRENHSKTGQYFCGLYDRSNNRDGEGKESVIAPGHYSSLVQLRNPSDEELKIEIIVNSQQEKKQSSGNLTLGPHRAYYFTCAQLNPDPGDATGPARFDYGIITLKTEGNPVNMDIIVTVADAVVSDANSTRSAAYFIPSDIVEIVHPTPSPTPSSSLNR